MKSDSSLKRQLLNELRRPQHGIISAAQLSTTLGISEVSVAKHILKLEELDFRIETTPNGYRLIGSPDIPYPWEFDEGKFNIVYYP
jgi:BirA family biotin operon repressor/biotin-[acetyl-CoA-carboxylase] ligase